MEPLFEKPKPPEPTKKYDLPKSGKMESVGKNLLDGFLGGKSKPKPLEGKMNPDKVSSKEESDVFGKKGLTRTEFRERLRRTPDKYLRTDEKLKLEKEMPTSEYGREIFKKTVEKKIEKLGKGISKKDSKTGRAIEHEIKFLEHFKEEK